MGNAEHKLTFLDLWRLKKQQSILPSRYYFSRMQHIYVLRQSICCARLKTDCYASNGTTVSPAYPHPTPTNCFITSSKVNTDKSMTSHELSAISINPPIHAARANRWSISSVYFLENTNRRILSLCKKRGLDQLRDCWVRRYFDSGWN